MFLDGYNYHGPGTATWGCDCPYCEGDCQEAERQGPAQQVYWWQWWGTTLAKMAAFSMLPVMDQEMRRLYPPILIADPACPPNRAFVMSLADWIPKTDPVEEGYEKRVVMVKHATSDDSDEWRKLFGRHR